MPISKSYDQNEFYIDFSTDFFIFAIFRFSLKENDTKTSISAALFGGNPQILHTQFF